jgi:hypothetical protein
LTQWQQIIATAAVGVGAVTIAQPLVRGLGKACVVGWKWFTKMPDFEKNRRPYWLYRFRWWWNSRPERRLGFMRWLAWHFICPLKGHHFPRGLPNDAGYWHIHDRWFGVCGRCTGMLMASNQERLDECERQGMKPNPISRKPIPRPKLAA